MWVLIGGELNKKNKHATTAATIRALCSAFCIHQLRLSQLQYICMHVNVSCGFPNYNTHILVFTYIVAWRRKLMSLEVLFIPTCGCCCCLFFCAMRVPLLSKRWRRLQIHLVGQSTSSHCCHCPGDCVSLPHVLASMAVVMRWRAWVWNRRVATFMTWQSQTHKQVNPVILT